ncbi:MAG: hypothetical protein C9356_20105 [Oleiphilus sp.]|nr:MAG: hypothetical protein C9356_20105 [Oleiphilus sp.]
MDDSVSIVLKTLAILLPICALPFAVGISLLWVSIPIAMHLIYVGIYHGYFKGNTDVQPYKWIIG